MPVKPSASRYREGGRHPMTQFAEHTGYGTRPRQEAFYLRTAVFCVHAPLTEVLAVVTQQAIMVFSHSRARSPNDLLTPQGTGSRRSDPNCVSARETCQRNLFHRAPVPVMCERGVVN